MRTRALAAAFIALAVAAAPLAAAADATVVATALAKNAANSAAVVAKNKAPANAAAAAPVASKQPQPTKKNAAAASSAAPTTLFAAISARPDLSSFAAALRLIGVDDELSQPDARTTIFAPTNAALDAFAKEVIGGGAKGGGDKAAATTVDNKALLTERYVTLLRRVAASAAGVDALGNGVYSTYGGQDVRLKKDGALLVATALPAARGVEARVLSSDAEGTIDLGNNGRVYVVDRVLRPADVVVVGTADEAAMKTAGGREPSNKKNAAANAATTTNPDTLRLLLAADADVSHFARLLQLLAPELAASAATAPMTVFAPSNAALDSYLERAHGLKSLDEVDKAVSVALPAAAKQVESTAAAATAAAASGAKSTKPSDTAAAAAVAAADAQKELQRLLALRANLTAAVAYHVSPGLAVDGATLLEGGRLLPTLLAARGVGADEAAVPVVAAANGVVGGEEQAKNKAVAAGNKAAAAAAVVAAPATPPATKMIGARAGGNGKGAALMLGDLGSSAVVLRSALAGDDALHVLDAVLLGSADPSAAGPSPGVAVVGGDGDVAVASADGMTTVAVESVAAPAPASSGDDAGARGGLDIAIRNQIIQNSIQANIVRALSGGMSVHQAAVYNSALANLAPYNTPYFYLMPPYSGTPGYGGYGYGTTNAYSGYWMG